MDKPIQYYLMTVCCGQGQEHLDLGRLLEMAHYLEWSFLIEQTIVGGFGEVIEIISRHESVEDVLLDLLGSDHYVLLFPASFGLDGL
jgi:hypothetical protein